MPVHDAGILPDGRIYYVMKLVRGERLERVAQAVPTAELLRLFLRICETVGFAHAQGIVHRDLKPSNVMVGSFGEVLVLDWGIARVTRDPEADGAPVRQPRPRPKLLAGIPILPDTAPGTVLGTPGFMAPEQAQGWHHLVDARTDVYALGAILRALVQPEPAGGRVPRALVSIWSRAMAAEPEQRYESAAALAADVARYPGRRAGAGPPGVCGGARGAVLPEVPDRHRPGAHLPADPLPLPGGPGALKESGHPGNRRA